MQQPTSDQNPTGDQNPAGADQKPTSVEEKQARTGTPFYVLWASVFALVPFIVVGGFWFAMDFTSPDVARLKIGNQQPGSDQERLINSLAFGAQQGLPWAAGGLVFGSIVLAYYRRQEEKRLHRKGQL